MKDIPLFRRSQIAVLSLLGFAAACTTRAPRPVAIAPPAASSMAEEELRPLAQPTIAIIDVNELPNADRHTVTVTGTIVNHGTGPTHDMVVHVEALDRNGGVLMSTESDPNPVVLAPGATGNFAVVFEDRADVERYHVEAIAR